VAADKIRCLFIHFSRIKFFKLHKIAVYGPPFGKELNISLLLLHLPGIYTKESTGRGNKASKVVNLFLILSGLTPMQESTFAVDNLIPLVNK